MNEFYECSIIEKPLENRIEYWFITTSQVVYYAYIIAAPSYLDDISQYDFISQHGYVIGFCPENEEEIIGRPHDPLIGPTICHIICNFVSRFDKVIMMYHCDAADGLQRARKITFNKWFQGHAGIKPIHRSGIQLEIQNTVAPLKYEYLGYFAFCPQEDITIADNEFKSFAIEMANSRKQLIRVE